MDRRTFLAASSTVVGACGLGLAAVPFLRSMEPAQDIVEAGLMDVDTSGIGVGEMRTVLWRKQPVFILHRSEDMIESAERIDPGQLKDPAKPAERVKRPEWLVCLGVCTHLGCVPDLKPVGVPGFDQPGFLCPCHGGEYDSLGRRLAGPPPENLHLLPYEFVGDAKLRLGSKTFPGYSADVRKVENLPTR